MNPRAKPGRLTAVRCTYAIVTTRAPGRAGGTRIIPSDFALRTMACHCSGQGPSIDSKSRNLYDCQVADKNGDELMLWGV